MNNVISQTIEDLIKKRVAEISEKKQLPTAVDIVSSDSIGEVVEKMIILHIRTWMLEDAISVATTDKEVADLKRKIDICFKQKRPKYIEAVNKMIDNAIVTGDSLKEDSVKFYK